MDLQPSLVLSALASSMAGGIFLSSGLEMRAKRVNGAASEAAELFSIWWLALAVYAVAGGSLDLTAALGITPLGFFIALTYMQMIALSIGLWGLVYYVAFVLTGRRTMRVPLALVYTTYYAILLFMITIGRPHGASVGTWSAAVSYSSPVVGASAGALLLVLPPLVASCTYLALMFFLDTPAQRLRVVLVTFGTVAWLTGTVLAQGPNNAWWTALPPILALVSAWCISWAYHTPAWVKRRLQRAAAAATADV